ncbi:hypothetical protein [Chloroflexus sp.]|uniref:hypothetical protein n=1 Tax=Chloroflexus sp. TaxID=1904827 RepID=UPI002ACF0984|nr:hypothetical protein [Chloroflexus sp.]
MMDKETLINHCLDALAKGEPIHEILARYPHEAATLQPILVVAESLAHLATDPTNEARIASRRAFLRQATTYQTRPALWQRLALWAASVALLILFAGGGLNMGG